VEVQLERRGRDLHALRDDAAASVRVRLDRERVSACLLAPEIDSMAEVVAIWSWLAVIAGRVFGLRRGCTLRP